MKYDVHLIRQSLNGESKPLPTLWTSAKARKSPGTARSRGEGNVYGEARRKGKMMPEAGRLLLLRLDGPHLRRRWSLERASSGKGGIWRL